MQPPNATSSRKIRFAVTISCIALASVALLGVFAGPRIARACGGFFCSRFPIDQTGEQIIFRQDGDQITAIVQITYAGEAKDFSWVIPVPGVPTFSLASNLLFSSLEAATRPQFILDRTGEGCIRTLETDGSGSFATGVSPAPASNDAVVILQQVSVGPFDIQVVRSDDPTALATWLVEHDYDLSDRGEELIEPYVKDGMNFVAVRLQQDSSVGDIQPLRMTYNSKNPVIPIRLTAIATQPNLGVTVWILGSGRAVPLNFLHVTPNYGKINWFRGTSFAYQSYKQLITDAMNEAGGQGFATDYCGPSDSIAAQLPDLAAMRSELARLNSIADAADAIAAITTGTIFAPASAQLLPIFTAALPLPPDEFNTLYQSASRMRSVYSASTLAGARAAILASLETSVVDPYAESVAVFDGNPTMTRLFTTLSADEMTLDPSFTFNPDLPEQSRERRATLAISCIANITQWVLTLGAGTGREGEVIARGSGSPPGAVPAELLAQSNIKLAQRLSENGSGEIVTNTRFNAVDISGPLPDLLACGSGVCGALPTAFVLVGLMLTRPRRRR